MKTYKQRKHIPSKSMKPPIAMRRIEIRNFRLLKKVRMDLEDGITLIVGRNNSGKTSVMELVGRLFSGTEPKFDLEDFSLSSFRRFWKAHKLKFSGHTNEEILRKLPRIKVRIVIGYDTTTSDLGALSECIIDLNPDCDEVFLDITFSPNLAKIDNLLDCKRQEGSRRKRQKLFFNTIRDRISKCYELRVEAIDPNDKSNRRNHSWHILPMLVRSDLIKAQRGLDDQPHNVLGKILEKLFNSAGSETADEKNRRIAQQLDDAVEKIQAELGEEFNSKLSELLPAFSIFGYPGLSDPELVTETSFNTKTLLSGHTRVLYSGHSGVNLPENLNGLGTRNLIYILMRLYAFFQSYRQQSPVTGVHIICIEEPEAHLHPQMQEVFIRQIECIIDWFSSKLNGGNIWPVQFIISTHSSHIANEAYFESIRYFLASADPARNSELRATRVANLRKMFSRIPGPTRDFIHKYMTLTRCDLFFADKAILIEGPSERILLPKMIEKTDEELDKTKKLSSQYVAVMEVGGSYAHLFFKFLKFLEIPSLIITDIDSVHGPKRRACPVSKGEQTSNDSIRRWFRGHKIDMKPSSLIKLSSTEKISGSQRLAYQVPEDSSGACGRSFEDAFILANLDHFRQGKPKKIASPEQFAWRYVQSLKKTEFAIKYAIRETSWVVPRYIAEGLRWLAEAPGQTFASTHTILSTASSRASEPMGIYEEVNA